QGPGQMPIDNGFHGSYHYETARRAPLGCIIICMPLRLALLLISTLAHAAVARVEITQRHDLAMVNYEEIIGKVYFAVDPKLPHHGIIVDLDRAPRNAQGL